MNKLFLFCMVMVGIINFLPVLAVGDHNAAINRIMLADVVGIACLAGAIAIQYLVTSGDSA